MERVLVVDDVKVFRDAVVRRLRGSGFDVRESASAMSAIESVAEVKPDIVLLDLKMPGMDGMAFLRWLRRQAGGAETRVVVVTAHVTRELQAEAAVLGVNDYLIKSTFGLQDLVNLINQPVAAAEQAA
jgi:two-component system NtrC family response regulator/two-component system response regulator AtoC